MRALSNLSVFIFAVLVILIAINLDNHRAAAFEVSSTKEQLFFTTIRIKTDKGIGTGFILDYKGERFLVTNKHVVKGANDAEFFFILADDKKNPILGKPIHARYADFEKRWVGHPNEQIDIAVMPLGRIINAIRGKGYEIFFRTIPESFIPNEEQKKNDIDAIEDVIFIGYPLGLFDEKNLTPIARTGITATPYNIDYEGLPIFLIDAAIFRGSSGSPVFIADTGNYTNKDGTTVISSRFLLLGILTDLYEYNEYAPIQIIKVPVQEIEGVEYHQKLNLGIVFKASAIKETIEAYLTKSGQTDELPARLPFESHPSDKSTITGGKDIHYEPTSKPGTKPAMMPEPPLIKRMVIEPPPEEMPPEPPPLEMPAEPPPPRMAPEPPPPDRPDNERH